MHLIPKDCSLVHCDFDSASFIRFRLFICSLQCGTSATLLFSEPLPATTTGHYTICCKNLSLTLLKMGKRFPETC